MSVSRRVRAALAGPLLVALVVAALPSGPAAALGATVIVAGSAVKVRPIDQVTGTSSAELVAARNEFESFQVVAQAGGSAMNGLTVALDQPLTGAGGAIPPENVVIYREAYYEVLTASDSEGATGLWPDALIPSVDPWYEEARNAFPVNVPANTNQAVWVDVLVPIDQTAGDYDGSLAVTAAGLDVSVPVHLSVIDWTMPSTASLASGYGMGWDTVCLAHYDGDSCITHEADGWALKALYARAALDDRISLAYPQYQPLANDQEQAWFEQFTLPLLNGTAPTRLPGAKLTSIWVDSGPWLAGWRDEARAKGFQDRSVVYACDEPNEDPTIWDACERNARDALAVWPEVSILITTPIDYAREFGAVPLIDTMVPVANYLDDKPGNSQFSGNQRPRYDQFLTDPRNRLWAYTSCMSEGCGDPPTPEPYWVGWPGYPIDEPASEARAMGWQSFRYDTSGELYFDVDYHLVNAWTDDLYDFGGNADGTLFYPGRPDVIGGTTDVPVESIRLKLIRDGYEDYEYLSYLSDNGMGRQARSLARKLFPNMYSSSVSDALMQRAHRRLAELVASLATGRR